MANEFIARKGLIVSGSTQLTGSLNVSRGITGSLFGTSSWASNAISSSFATSASWAPGGAGAAFPFSGAAAITGSLNITGSLFTHTYSLVTSSLGNASGSMSINLSNANYFTATTSASTTWVFSNPPTNRAVGFALALASGGAATQIWPSTIRWPGGSAPTLTPSGGIDVLTFITDNTGTAWRGVFSIVDSR